MGFRNIQEKLEKSFLILFQHPLSYIITLFFDTFLENEIEVMSTKNVSRKSPATGLAEHFQIKWGQAYLCAAWLEVAGGIRNK